MGATTRTECADKEYVMCILHGFLTLISRTDFLRGLFTRISYLECHGEPYDEWMVNVPQYGPLSLRVFNLIFADDVFFFKHLI